MPRPRGRGYHERMNHPRRTLLAVLSGCLLGVLLAAAAFWYSGPRPPGRGPAGEGRAPARGSHRPHQGRLRRQHRPPRTDGEGDPRHGRASSTRIRHSWTPRNSRTCASPPRAITPASASRSRCNPASSSCRADRRLAGRARRHPPGRRDRRHRGPQGRGHGAALEAIAEIRGEPGTVVNLTLAREAARPFDLAVERAIVSVHSVRFEVLEPGYGYLRISQFSETTGATSASAACARGAGGRAPARPGAGPAQQSGRRARRGGRRVGCLPRERHHRHRRRPLEGIALPHGARRPAT